MSRTVRLKNQWGALHLSEQSSSWKNKRFTTYFRCSGHQDLKQRAEVDDEWEHVGYRPRSRHTCRSWPHYLCAWEDIMPSIGIWLSAEHLVLYRPKPFYCRKKNTSRR